MARWRYLAAVLALALVAAGCDGRGDQEGQENRITFWSAEDVADRIRATQAIIDRFERQTGIQVELVAVAEDQIATQVRNASAAGELPDVLGAMGLEFVHSFAIEDVSDPEAAAAVIDRLGRATFSERALRLVEVDGQPHAVPSDSWTQLIVYRKDLFDAAGLEPPTTFDRIQRAAAELNERGRAGIVMATRPGEVFTQQTFEYFALANGCQLTDGEGNVTLNSPACVNTFKFYTDLVRNSSVRGAQDVESTRAAYFAGRAAMVAWSPFILDEMAGLRDDALPTCPECRADPAFLAKNSGIVAAVQGPDGPAPAQYGQVTSFVITKDASQEPARRFVEFMMREGYLDWLALAPEGKFPVRRGTTEEPDRYVKGWGALKAGVDREAPLAELYSPEVIDTLHESVDSLSRWGFEQGQGELVGAMTAELPVTQALARSLGGSVTPEEAAQQAQADVEEIARSIG